MFEENDNFYPTKPELIENQRQNGFLKFLISVALFFIVFVTLIAENNYLLATQVVLIILVHELGHLLTMKYFKFNTNGIIFIPFLGAMVSGSKPQVTQSQKFWINIMGPMPGIIIGTALLIYCSMTNADLLLVEIALLLIILNLFNLIPLDPLDGGNIIDSLFFPSNDKVKMYFTLISSVIIIIIGAVSGFYALVIFGFFMGFKVRAYQRNRQIHNDLDEIQINYKKSYKELSDREYWTMRRIFLQNNPKIRDLAIEDDAIWENENLLVNQINQLLKQEIIKDLSINKVILYTAFYITVFVLPLVVMFMNLDLIKWYFNYESI